MQRVARKELPVRLEAALVRGLGKAYRKRDVYVTTGVERVTPAGGYWDHGSRDDWLMVPPVGEPRVITDSGGGFPFTGKVEPYELAEGSVVIRHGVFAGKPATAHLFVRDEVQEREGVK